MYLNSQILMVWSLNGKSPVGFSNEVWRYEGRGAFSWNTAKVSVTWETSGYAILEENQILKIVPKPCASCRLKATGKFKVLSR